MTDADLTLDERLRALAERLRVLAEHVCCYGPGELEELLEAVRADAVSRAPAEHPTPSMGTPMSKAEEAALRHQVGALTAELTAARERETRLRRSILHLHASAEALADDRDFLVQRINDLSAAYSRTAQGMPSPRGANLLAATVDHPHRPGNRA